MSRSRIILAVLIGALVWLNKDYLGSKKDIAVAQINDLRASQHQFAEPPQELKTFNP